MTAAWTDEPFVVHVNGDADADERAAGSAGAVVRRLPLAGLHDLKGLEDRAADVFEIPYPIGGPAGLIDWLSDLEWLDVDDRGVLIVVDAAGGAPGVVDLVAGLLPPVLDRWRSQPGRPALAHLVGVGDLPSVENALERANLELDEAGRQPWAATRIERVLVVIG